MYLDKKMPDITPILEEMHRRCSLEFFYVAPSDDRESLWILGSEYDLVACVTTIFDGDIYRIERVPNTTLYKQFSLQDIGKGKIGERGCAMIATTFIIKMREATVTDDASIVMNSPFSTLLVSKKGELFSELDKKLEDIGFKKPFEDLYSQQEELKEKELKEIHQKAGVV